MEVFVWDERYLTREPLIDEEHQGLVRLINQVVALQGEAADPGTILQVVSQLIDYAATHFAHEEALMDGAGCDERHAEKHKSIHRNFARQVTEMRAEGSAALDAEYLMRFLSSWLAYHILGMDQSLARQVQRIRAGMPPAQAYDAEKSVVSDPATASLLAAMHGLYGVVVQRNEQLQAFNETLEETVRQRTADLQARNAELLSANQRLAKVRQQLLQAEKLASLGQLAAGVAHEINNPVSFVLSNLSTLGNYQEDLFRVLDTWNATGSMPESVRQLSEQVELPYLREDVPVLLRESREGLERVKKIVQDLRDFSQVDRAQEWSWNALAKCVETSLALLDNRLSAEIEVRKTLPVLPDLWCCAPDIHQVLTALFSNAIEAMPEGGLLSLSSGQSGDELWLDVADTGIGIAEAALPRIFDPFYSTKRIGAGTGMGLAQAWGIVQQHQGRIEVRSTPGKGSVFHIVLPLKAQ